MKHHVLLPLLTCVVTLASFTCFRAEVCTPCGRDGHCAGNLICSKRQSVCVEKESDMCVLADGGHDADPGTDVASDIPSSDDTGGSSDASTDAAASACIDRCCIGAASCHEFPDRVRQGLLLWADRTSLGRPGFPLDTWMDRSAGGRHFTPLNVDAPPRVQLDPVGPIAEIDGARMVLATSADPTLRLGIEDFTILALARCDVETQQGVVFEKRNVGRPRTGVTVFCNHDGGALLAGIPRAHNRAFLQIIDDDRSTNGLIVSQRTDIPGKLHLLAARRTEGRRIQLRVDGKVEGQIEISPSVDLSDELRLFVGAPATDAPPFITNFDGGLAAIVVIRGPLTDAELEALEAFLLRAAGEGAPPL